MIIAHHRSIVQDSKRHGILDLHDDWDDPFELHIKDWEVWSPTALEILGHFGFNVRNIGREEAKANYEKVLDYCLKKPIGWSKWKGLLVAADHYASALGNRTDENINQAFINPILTFYNRQNNLYPLSLMSANDKKKHTIVTAPTGAGKTDFLIRRCDGRFFYTLPFQASINAMFERIKDDLAPDNPEIDVRILHASSRVFIDKQGNAREEKALQDKVGSAIKVLTPHQIASIVFGTRGFEAMLIDLMGCDIILDEIHTYTGVTKAIVLKIVEILNYFNCRIHIGTATMPSKLYENILKILGEENVYQVKLDQEILDTFDRHLVHKIPNFEETYSIIDNALKNGLKVLIVCNRVSSAQKIYEELRSRYNSVKTLLIHSRFRRKDRARLEKRLKDGFNDGNGPCIVVSTQVVEVSLDLNFDLMITEAAPLDSLIQRFGRINRKRTPDTIGHYKPVYVIQPPDNAREAKPYDIEYLKSTYDVLPDGELLRERNIQKMIDLVFSNFENHVIEQNCRFKNGQFQIKELSHLPKSVLLESLDIDSVSCITEDDVERYKQANVDEKIAMEIPIRYWSVATKELDTSSAGNHPFIVPDKAYSEELGLVSEKIKPGNYDVSHRIL